MKRHTLALLMTFAACVVTAPAATYYWLGVGSSASWTDAGNWWHEVNGPTAVPPDAGDVAIIGFPFAGFEATPRPNITTVLYNPPGTSTGPLGTLAMDWHASLDGNQVITVSDGGGLEVANTIMHGSGTETSTINISGGYLRSWTQLNMATTATSSSQININSGFIYTPSLVFGSGAANIDLEPGALLYLFGDQTAFVASSITSDKITGGNDTLTVQYNLTTLPGFTTIYAVPEPATIPMALLALGCFLRRRRR